jgi:hypothetical protein
MPVIVQPEARSRSIQFAVAQDTGADDVTSDTVSDVRSDEEVDVPEIRTTHTGSLPRPAPLPAAIAERERGGPELDPDEVRTAVIGCVHRQVETGLDVVNDGELARVSYVTYVRNRLTGLAALPRRGSRAGEDVTGTGGGGLRGPARAARSYCPGGRECRSADATGAARGARGNLLP